MWLWRARFVKEVIAEVVDTLASARNLKYSEILALDRKIRLFDLADALRQSALLVNPAAAEGGVMWYLQQYADVVIKGNSERDFSADDQFSDFTLIHPYYGASPVAFTSQFFCTCDSRKS